MRINELGERMLLLHELVNPMLEANYLLREGRGLFP
jgi:hypothetical protein